MEDGFFEIFLIALRMRQVTADRHFFMLPLTFRALPPLPINCDKCSMS